MALNEPVIFTSTLRKYEVLGINVVMILVS